MSDLLTMDVSEATPTQKTDTILIINFCPTVGVMLANHTCIRLANVKHPSLPEMVHDALPDGDHLSLDAVKPLFSKLRFNPTTSGVHGETKQIYLTFNCKGKQGYYVFSCDSTRFTVFDRAMVPTSKKGFSIDDTTRTFLSDYFSSRCSADKSVTFDFVDDVTPFL